MRRCLSNEPADPWQSAQDVALRLREIAEANPETEARRQARRSLRWLLPAATGAVVLALVLIIVLDRLIGLARLG